MPEEKVAERGLPGRFDFLEHPADVYIRAYGNDLLELFENAGIALFETMVNTSKVRPLLTRHISVDGIDLENLLYRWLEELLTIYYSENIVLGEIVVSEIVVRRTNDGSTIYLIKGVCKGEKFDHKTHEPRVEVKAVTYHLMRIVKDEDSWRAYFVLDI